jgi:pimeloyl-ACP methyl ester carboxylesterase
MKKSIKITLGIIVTMIVGLVTIFLIGNIYNFNEENFQVKLTKNNLQVTLVTPKNEEQVKGTIFFIHGDGAQNATQDGGYKPLMERFAKRGYASVSWDKPGVGKSSGNWLTQSMDDRADEASEIIDWMKQNHPNFTNEVGLWGASQAGWVIPKIDKKRRDIAFSFLVAPGVNWLQQSEYYTEQQALQNGHTESETSKIKQDFRKDADLILLSSDYKSYQRNGGQSKMDEARFQFVKQNMLADSEADLKKMIGKVHLILGEKDINVDSKITKKAYVKSVKDSLLTVKTITNAEHRMANPKLAHSEFLLTTAAIFSPKYHLVSPEFLDYSESLLQ